MAQQLRVSIIGDSRGYSRALAQAGQSTAGFGSGLGRLAKTATLVAGAAGLGAIAVTLKAGISEWMQSAKVAAQTGAVIKSTGGIANVTAKHVDELANSLMRKTGIDDENIAAGENWLLTFKAVRNEAGKGNDIFDQATKVATDLAVAQANAKGTTADLATSTTLLGKALQDPVKGLTALKKVGVDFTEGQKKTIKALVESGDLMGAQKIILKELNSQVGGSAEAYGKTLPGQIAILKESFNNLAGEIVTSLAPALQRVLTWTTAHWPEISQVFKSVAGVIGTALSTTAAFVQTHWETIKAVFEAGVVAVVATAKGIQAAIAAIIPVVQAVVSWVQQNWPQISAIFTATLGAIVDWVRANWPQISETFRAVFDTVKGIVQGAVTVITALWNQFGVTILAQLRATWTFVQSYLAGVFNVIRGIFNVFAGLLSGDWSRAWQGLQQIFTGIWQQITAVIQLALSTIVNLLTAAGRLMLAAVQGPWNAIKTLATSTFNGVVSAITAAIGRATTAAAAVGHGIVTGIGNGLAAIVGVVKGGLDKIWGIISQVASLAFNAAKAIGAQIVHGIVSGLGDIVSEVGSKLKSGVEKALHAIDPRNLRPWSPVSHWAVMLAQELTKEINSVERTLGVSLTRALTAALRGATDKAGDVAVKGMNHVGQLIVAAAKKYGVDARAALAVAMGEGGIKFGAVGDSGHAFGPFQMNNAGGVLTGMDSAAASKYANSVEGINAALRGMAAAGAAGKVGLAAITAIISKWERPRDVAASITAAAAAYKTLGPQIASAVASGGSAITAAQLRTLTGLKNLVVQFTPIIGREHALGIIRGLVATTPTLVQQAKAQMVAAAAAARQAVVDAKGAFISAFNDLANAALTAFDTRWAAWVPPTQRLLDKMQLAEQVKQVQDQLATAMTAVTGGGAFDASALSKQLGDALASAMSTALGSIAGAKTEEALNKVAAQVQTQVLAAIDQTSAAATAQALSAVATAQAQLTAAQAQVAALGPIGAGGATDEQKAAADAAAAAQAALDTAVGNQRALEAAILAEKELALGQLVAAEAKRHAAVGAVQREGLAQQLKEEFDWLSKHPAQWAKMGADVQKILSDYNVKLVNAGTAWANKFGDGITAGIPAAVAAARRLATLVAAELPSTSSPLKPAKTGPLSFHPRDMGKAWASNFASGLASGRIGNIVGSIAGAPRVGGGGMVAAGAGGGLTVNFHIDTVVGDADAFARQATPLIHRELLRMAGRNGGLALG